MSRYAQRLAPPPAAPRYRQPPRSYYDDEPVQRVRGYREEPQLDEDDDDETAVATDLSIARQQQARRAVQFGENEVEEFNGSEAPDAVLPARSTSRNAFSPPIPPTRLDGRRSAQLPVAPAPAPARAPPPPRAPSRQRFVDDDEGYEMPPPPAPSRSRYDAPVSFARSTAYDYEPPRHERERAWDDYGGGEADEPGAPGYGDDDDDAFTAVATGVATDLDMEDSPAASTRRTDDPRARLAAAQQQQQAQQFLAIPRPPSRGVQVRRASPVQPSYQQAQAPRYSPSGFDEDDFSSVADDAPPFSFPPPGQPRQRAPQQVYQLPRQQQQQLPPPPVAPVQRTYLGGGGGGIGRPVSSASSRMRVDDDYDEPPPPVNARAPPPPPPKAVAYERPQALTREQEREAGGEDSVLERELIDLLRELNFSLALKDFHDALRIGVQKTLVSEDGMGHAYVKIHVQRLPKPADLEREKHLKPHWVPLAGSRWEFRTASHSVTVVFKTVALAAYEAQFLTSTSKR
ncbi:hypothetical protein JCM3775_001309 [Rhodotorula graminis]|uniref:Uncharacterized protein n=1 Tax=Rhodotorula graminis (strain WP1) TaxID=578459 RepID=A0A194SCT6_RHOGW|nr:uncharacterized protein RHOBADRAFT_40947 [Rhodotorula graminis WP1]KPV78402.1 hypothetical protein RHOBADRAFT_40947 [Rhodotorula graminis WP1]